MTESKKCTRMKSSDQYGRVAVHQSVLARATVAQRETGDKRGDEEHVLRHDAVLGVSQTRA